MRGIDVSVYSGEIPVEKWRAVKAEGYELAIIGLWHGLTPNWHAAQQTETAWEAYMEVAYYALLAPWTGLSGKEQVQRGLDMAAGIPCDSFFAIDCEIDGIDERMIHEAVEEADRAGDPAIYTADWWWRGHFGNPTTFSHLPLWTAQYPLVLPNQPNLLDIPNLYGGWTRDKLVGWQYTDTTQFHGINCCKDWFDDKFIKGEEPMEITEERVRAIIEYSGPGLEMQARMAISAAFEAGASFAKVGYWDAAKKTLATIEQRMKQWHRWEE